MNHLVIQLRRPRAFMSPMLALLACVAVNAPYADAQNVGNPDPGLIARWEPCEPNTGVTVIVDDQTLGEEMIYVGCALGEQPSGVEALEHAGFALEGTSTYGLAFICRIDGEPSPAEQACKSTPPADAYWSYWRGKPGGRWSFSGVGADSPESRSPVNSIEGWSFGSGAVPRIPPMDGSGPTSFHLPPSQESSVIPAMHAREWLAPTLDETAKLAEEEEAAKDSTHPEPKLALSGAIALARSGEAAGALEPIATWLERSCEEKGAIVEGCPLRELANPSGRAAAQTPTSFALAVLGLQALGENPSSFAGMDLREALEAMIVKSSGEVRSEGEPSAAVEVTAPTVLALARTGTLPTRALKTLNLLLGAQNATSGAFETKTSVNVEAVEALAAAREQGASVLGQSQLEAVETSLAKVGSYLESIQEAEGGVRKQDEPESEPTVESTAFGAVGLALTGRQAPAERAARWVSRYQVTAEYAGLGNPATGEHTPAEDVIGAFLGSEDALRDALASGVESNRSGRFYTAQLPTIDALAALVTAGPYGPYEVSFNVNSLLFEERTVGTQSKPLSVLLTNHDVRSFTIAGAEITGPQAADFGVHDDECAGRTLVPGESCEVSATFTPTTSGRREALLQVTLHGSEQTLTLPLTGIGEPEPAPQPIQKHNGEDTSQTSDSSTGSQQVLGTESASTARVQTPRLDGQGARRGLVGVSWRILEGAAGLSSWTIASRTLGARDAPYVTRATGAASVTSAELKLPPGFAYELQITFTDALGVSATTQIGRVLVPYDDRSSLLHYTGRWQRIAQPGAWLDTVSRGQAGDRVSVTLAAGRPVLMLRASATAAQVEVRAGSRGEVFAVAKGAPGALRQITAAARSRAGTVTLRVLKGTVDLDGVADEG